MNKSQKDALIDKAMRLARECASKQATPANWHVLRSHLERMIAADREHIASRDCWCEPSIADRESA
jgi:hypothetical protein